MTVPNHQPSPLAARATSWHLRNRTLHFGTRPLVMGIVNVTPDSFSDGGKFFSVDAALQAARGLATAGAEILDIGGESTRPYSTPVSVVEELRRVMPVVEAVCREVPVPVSIDTSKAEVADACLAAGAEIINDVTALAGDPQMVAVAKSWQAGVCAMHMQGTPQTMQDYPTYENVVEDVFQWLSRKRRELIEAGIGEAKICLDPGIGFGKTHEHNLQLAANCWRFHALGSPLLVGHSRKGFIGKVLGDKDADRTAGTIGVSCALAAQGVQIVRVHDVAAVRQALMLFEAAT